MAGKVYRTCECCGEEFTGKSSAEDFDCCKECALADGIEVSMAGYTNEWWDDAPRGEWGG